MERLLHKSRHTNSEYSQKNTASTLSLLTKSNYQSINHHSRNGNESKLKKKQQLIFEKVKELKTLSLKQPQNNKNNDLIKKMIYDNKRLAVQYEKLYKSYNIIQLENKKLKNQIEQLKKTLPLKNSCNHSNHEQTQIIDVNSQGHQTINFFNLSHHQILEQQCSQNIEGKELQIEKLQKIIQNYKEEITKFKSQKQILLKQLSQSQNQVKVLWQATRKCLISKKNTSTDSEQKDKLIKILQIQNLQLKAEVQNFKKKTRIEMQKIQEIKRLMLNQG